MLQSRWFGVIFLNFWDGNLIYDITCAIYLRKLALKLNEFFPWSSHETEWIQNMSFDLKFSYNAMIIRVIACRTKKYYRTFALEKEKLSFLTINFSMLLPTAKKIRNGIVSPWSD